MHAKRLFFALLITVALPAPAYAAFDWSLYGSLLHEYVKPGIRDGKSVNLVDYAGLRNDPMFSELVGEVQDYDPMQLTTKSQRKAFYINAYNILELSLITRHWPVKSIKDIGSSLQDAWDVILLQNMDGQFSLKGIRKRILVPMGDLRVLFAIDCSSVSGPDLRREPYEASTINRQLNDQVRRFLSQKDKGVVVRYGVAHMSQLFDRYQDAFHEWGGAKNFIHRYLPKLTADHYLSDLHYDWHINSQSLPIK